jgi:hypothetical protein
MNTLGDAELDRYARHIVLREVGGAGQLRLKQRWSAQAELAARQSNISPPPGSDGW